MKREKREEGSNSIDKISELPQDILQRILYWLSQEDAVRTSVLSKSWRNIWCTRPNLNFSDATFKGNMHQFLSVVTPLYNCIVIKDLEELPSVVFGAESLQDLHLAGFVLHREAIERMVLFKNLTSLSLQRVSIEEGIFEKIISCCPLIETLDIKVSSVLRKIIVKNLYNLKYFSFSDDVYRPASFEKELYISYQYDGDFIPSISFATVTSTEWISDIHLTCELSHDASSWFIKLHELLKSISQSKISLHFDRYSLNADRDGIRENINMVQDINGGNKHASVVVEKFKFNWLPLSLISSILNGVFSICRPRNIEDFLCGDKGEMKRIERLWKILTERKITKEDRF
ncbi:hypothetical protein MIMGU_mgv1a018336mg, partial [Erythranthe guttata]